MGIDEAYDSDSRRLQIAADTASAGFVEVGHLAFAVTSQTDSMASQILQHLDVDHVELRAQLERDARR